MKSNEVLLKKCQGTDSGEPLIDTTRKSIFSRVSYNLRKIIYITFLTGIGILLNSCMAGYVETSPTYVEYARPQRPSNLHIWIDGDWRWNRQTHAYVQRVGYWEKPNQSRTFVAGYWQTSPHGKYWKSGHWQNNGRKGGKNNR